MIKPSNIPNLTKRRSFVILSDCRPDEESWQAIWLLTASEVVFRLFCNGGTRRRAIFVSGELAKAPMNFANTNKLFHLHLIIRKRRSFEHACDRAVATDNSEVASIDPNDDHAFFC